MKTIHNLSERASSNLKPFYSFCPLCKQKVSLRPYSNGGGFSFVCHGADLFPHRVRGYLDIAEASSSPDLAAHRVESERQDTPAEIQTRGTARNSNDARDLPSQHSGRGFNAREIKSQVDLAAIAGRFTKLRRCGSQLIGLCPFHSERHASFYVHPEKQVFKCFGCGAGGDVFVFVMRATGCDFRRALEILADFSEPVARDGETRSGSRLGAGVGAQPLSPAKRGALFSQSVTDSRARILAQLDATNVRLRRIAQTNRRWSADLATACEPERGSSPLLEETE